MLDLTQYKLLVDVWSGDDDPDWAALKAGGVAGAFLRMNESDGSLTLDKQFHNWANVSGLARGAYVVISPFVSRQAYTTWILANLPTDCKVVALDVEIRGSTMAAYSALVIGVATDLQKAGLKVLIYSGAWFYGYLDPWPRQFDQWWARYDGSVQPKAIPPDHGVHIIWEALKVKLAALPSFDPLDGYTMQPGHMAIWQCSSAFILPGGPAHWSLDVNLMPVTDFERIFGGQVQPPEKTLEQRVTALEAWKATFG